MTRHSALPTEAAPIELWPEVLRSCSGASPTAFGASRYESGRGATSSLCSIGANARTAGPSCALLEGGER